MSKCVACKAEGATVIYNNKIFCSRCASLFGTCGMCEHNQKCEFSDNPAPMPKMVMIRQVQETPNGHIESIQQIPNPQRIKAFCEEDKCKCFDYLGKEAKCMRQFGTCANYKEHEF